MDLTKFECRELCQIDFHDNRISLCFDNGKVLVIRPEENELRLSEGVWGSYKRPNH